MNKITILICLVLLTLFSCDVLSDYVYEQRYNNQTLFFIEEAMGCESLSSIGIFLSDNISYTADTGEDCAQSPEETWRSQSGDCEDFAILFMNIAYFSLGIKCELVLVQMSRSVENGGEMNHAAVRYNGIVYEPQTGETLTTSVSYYYTFDTVFN